MIKILVVDDDSDILKVLSANLKLEGYNVVTAENGIDAYNLSMEDPPDLMILDLSLPDFDGIQLCRKLRKENNDVPIIILTARDSVSDKVLGLECGADDYIVKPFNFLELNARIKSCLRRYDTNSNLEKKESIKFGSIKIYPEKREVFTEDKKIILTKTEFNLLLFFVNNRGKVISRKYIKNNIWKDKDIYNWSRTIDVHVNHLRKKLGQYLNIETVAGVGYILN